jgi:hypothetical protein
LKRNQGGALTSVLSGELSVVNSVEALSVPVRILPLGSPPSSVHICLDARRYHDIHTIG